ncbi:MAG: YicC family protein [Blastocatellia bacterium]|nr:YicC family protein [Blastocatellia bacterium]MBL8196234.1 YicC family protein [Blastocatellia bacterium]MBN8725136.1 YicC family protein [Acidobacteriota bacterium]
MLKSMTGFGQAVLENEKYRITADVKTVNNRFLDIHIKMPSELSTMEIALKKRVQSFLKRGRVDLIITLTQTAESSYEINLPLIKGYFKALQQIQMQLDLDTSFDLGLLAKLPNAIQLTTTSANLDQDLNNHLTTVVDQALEKLTAMRLVEGKELELELMSRLEKIEASIPEIENNAGQLTEFYRERLQKRMQEILPNSIQLDQGRFSQEVAYLAERSDITEEIARLKSHVLQFKELLTTVEEAGKKFDFILQEMNREANTILAKSGELNISKMAIEIKTEIEKLREQVQNVE